MCWGCFYESAKTLRFICSQDEHIGRYYSAWYPWVGIAAVFAATLPTLNCLQRGQVGDFKVISAGFRIEISDNRSWDVGLGF